VTDKTAHIVDVSLDDSDKTITVPGNRSWELVSGTVTITTTVTAGNRTPRIEFLDEAANVIFTVDGTQSVPASQTDAAFGDISIAAASDPTIVPILLPPGGAVRYYDFAAIAATADDMEVRLSFLVRNA